jgi:hypothetical protein
MRSGVAETLHNGIVLPQLWPPRQAFDPTADASMPVPYLERPPTAIPIDLGRQLFVDDFLIEATDLRRTFHSAVKCDDNPLFAPETPMEQEQGVPAATPKSGGVWWDRHAGHYVMWYDAGWMNCYAYATSADAINWCRPELGPVARGKRTVGNRILPGLVSDSSTFFIDENESDPARRYKCFVRQPTMIEARNGKEHRGRLRAYVMSSPDGICWSDLVPTSPVGDRSTIFYNPFRRKWVYSIRSYHFDEMLKRVRSYRECDDLIGEPVWDEADEVFWTRADRDDPQDPQIGEAPQLYNLDAVAYESILLGIFEILLGPRNDVCARGGFPKTTDLTLGFSRDGFHWHRPCRDAFIASSRAAGTWDRGYVQSVGGCCLVFEDELRFFYTGFRGDPGNKTEKEIWNSGMYAHGSTGVATLRRDGFASLDAGQGGGSVTTRPVRFSGSYLFVNVDAASGALRAELLDEDGRVLDGYDAASCLPVAVGSTRHRVTWKQHDRLPATRGRPVRFRFLLESGRLYAFWVSREETGESGGYLAAGSADYSSYRDEHLGDDLQAVQKLLGTALP